MCPITGIFAFTKSLIISKFLLLLSSFTASHFVELIITFAFFFACFFFGVPQNGLRVFVYRLYSRVGTVLRKWQNACADRGVLLHLALGVVLLVHRAGVVGAVHGLALHAPVVLLLLQAAPDL